MWGMSFMCEEKDNKCCESKCEERACEEQECESCDQVCEKECPKLDAVEAKWEEKYIRLNADFQNYKKRTEQESILWIRRSKEDVLQNVLNIVDDFDRAFSECEKHGVSDEDQIWLDGFKMTSKSLYKLLKKYDVRAIETDKGFDPEYHEAVAHIDSKDHKTGHIVHVMQKGFMIGKKVLRPAKVGVAK